MGQDRRDNPWERIASHLDEALDDVRALTKPPAGPPAERGGSRPAAPGTARHLLELLAEARRDVRAREVEASVSATRAARLETELGQQQRRADTLVRIGKAINAVRELPALLQLVVDLAVEATGAERGLVIVPEAGGKPKEYTAVKNLDPSDLGAPSFAISRSIVERVFRQGEPLVTTDAQNDPNVAAAPSIRSLHIRSIICVPILNKDGVAGVIYVDSRIRPDSLLHHDPELLATIADQAAVAIDNARLYEDLSKSFSELSGVKTQADEILESIASGVVVLDAQDGIAQFNRAAEITFGLSASTLVGRHSRILNTWLPGFSSLLERYKAQTDPRMQIEVSGNHFIRGPIVLQVTFFRVRDQLGLGPGTAVVLNDLTASRALEAENLAAAEKSQRIARSFERYVAPHVVNALLRDPEAVVLGGTRQTATMMFADIRGFTELSERLMPEEVVELLNRYLDPVVNVVFSNSGLLDKFYGDGIMAVFGAPRPSDDDALRAVTAARQILEQVRLLNGQPGVDWPLSVSVGLATGDVVAGHIGSAQRLEYTVIGDAVNLASRLQGIAQPNQILADAATYERVKASSTATRRLARIKGKAGLTPVYVLHA
ncbi:MAG TPA: adenylate/guanylate cyclase domain-containing protein [Candidatus Eremiobacteraceae bacterium]|nr:adenylate/guanylate cyclase domain-containing protein [Candidatus Eremiobacteraceae bacterium]